MLAMDDAEDEHERDERIFMNDADDEAELRHGDQNSGGSEPSEMRGEEGGWFFSTSLGRKGDVSRDGAWQEDRGDIDISTL